jgi:hypothetical protein
MFLPAKRVRARTASPCRLPGSAALIVLLASSVSAQQESSSVTGSAQQHSRPEPTAVVAASAAPVTVLEDTPIHMMTAEAIRSRHAEQGSPLLFTVSENVMVGDAVAVPCGATVRGELIGSKKSGRLSGSPELTLKLVALELGDRTYPLYTYQLKVTGTSKTRPSEVKALRGAEVGAVVGAFATQEKGGVTDTARAVNMTAGAAVGAGVGKLVCAASAGPTVLIPAESQVDVSLASPITVTPVSAKEAARLAQALHPDHPVLYFRGETP